MAEDDVREAAKAEIRRREWAAQRGKATRAYIKEHSELADELAETGDITIEGPLPQYATKASIVLELTQRAKRRETSKSVREWAQDNPEEAQRIRDEVRKEWEREHPVEPVEAK